MSISNNNINLFCQFFINKTIERQNEIKYVLEKNVNNNFINNIYLLNEKIYTDEELGVKSDKIIQIDIGKRLEFKDVFNFIKNNNVKGYNIILNSDIFLDDSIEKLLYSDLHNTRKMCCLLRYELNIDDINKSKLFDLQSCSQDTWIIEISKFNFEFGKPACDNVLVYLFYKELKFEIINDPEIIKTYHYHHTNMRNYTESGRLVGLSYADITPASIIEGFTSIKKNINPLNILILIILIILIIYN